MVPGPPIQRVSVKEGGCGRGGREWWCLVSSAAEDIRESFAAKFLGQPYPTELLSLTIHSLLVAFIVPLLLLMFSMWIARVIIN